MAKMARAVKRHVGKVVRRGRARWPTFVERIEAVRRWCWVAAQKRVLFRPPKHGRRVNVGAGRWYVRGWETVDYYVPSPYADVRLDLRDRPVLPYADGSCGVIYCSHVLEHLPDVSVRHALAEFARVLEPGGVVRLVVPDMDRAFAAYRDRDDDFFDHGGVRCVGPTIEAKLVNFFASYRLDDYSGGPELSPDVVRAQLDSLDKHAFVAWCVAQIPSDASYLGHVNGFDHERLARMGRDVGLCLDRSSYRGSAVPEMRGPTFDNRPRVSLYMEGHPA